VDVIGMTNLTEAKLAREAEICYAALALISDYDVWHETEEDVSVESVVAVLSENVQTSKRILRRAILSVPEKRTCPCARALKDVIITSPEVMPKETRQDLELLIGKYI
jgi:5'-methylthioadenosine phosphorylase